MEAATKEPVEIKVATREDEMRRPFSELAIGNRFISRARTITETDVVNFAALTADWHPLHTNAEFAKESMFGQRVAHGMLLLSYSIGLVPNEYVLALRRLSKVVFKKPVFFGDTIQVEGTVVNLRPLNEEAGLVTGRWRIFNQEKATVFKLEIEAVWSDKEI